MTASGWATSAGSTQEEGYPLYVAEIALDALAGGREPQGRRPRRVPRHRRRPDAAPTRWTTPWAEIDRTIAELRPPDLVSWEMTVRYQGPGVPEGAVNTTIHFLYNSPERSLTQEEVNERQLALAAELRAALRLEGIDAVSIEWLEELETRVREAAERLTRASGREPGPSGAHRRAGDEAHRRHRPCRGLGRARPSQGRERDPPAADRRLGAGKGRDPRAGGAVDRDVGGVGGLRAPPGAK